MSELKPCPFCGGKAELICAPGYFKTGLSSSGWIIKCLNGCCNQMPYGSDHDAIEAWNRRAGDAPTIEPEQEKGKWIPHNEKSREYIGTVLVNVEYDYWLCDICGYRVEKGQPMYNYCPNCGADMRGEQNE